VRCRRWPTWPGAWAAKTRRAWRWAALGGFAFGAAAGLKLSNALPALVAPLLAIALAGVLRPPRGGLALWTVAHTLAFWVWHAPPAYAWALSSNAAYWLMQASLLVTAWGMWAHIRTAPMPMGIAALLAMMVQMGLLGALLVFNSGALYAPHYLTTQAWGFSPLEDQQLAGLIMWAPAAGLYLGGALWLLARWFVAEEHEVAAR
jgi:putative membrane protein